MSFALNINDTFANININTDNLVTLPSNLAPLPESKMATPSQVEINMARDMVPEYSGGSKDLAYFISQADTFINLLKQGDSLNVFNKLLLEQVKSKLRGEARDVLIKGNFILWSDIKKALVCRFGDPRSEDLLVNDLITCFQQNNESFEAYFEKIKYKLQVVIEHINISENNQDIKQSKTRMYEVQALNTMKSGIIEPYCTHMLNLPINSLEEALLECRRYDNNKAQISFMNFLRNRSKPLQKPNAHTNFKHHTHQSQNNKPFVPSFIQNRGFNSYQHKPSFSPNPQPTRPEFPRGPINIQPRQLQPQRYPTNSEVFGKKLDNNKPVPMSTTSAYSYRPKQNSQVSNMFKKSYKPQHNFIAEELYNAEYMNSPENLPQNENLYHNHHYESEACEFNDNEENFQTEASEPEPPPLI